MSNTRPGCRQIRPAAELESMDMNNDPMAGFRDARAVDVVVQTLTAAFDLVSKKFPDHDPLMVDAGVKKAFELGQKRGNVSPEHLVEIYEALLPWLFSKFNK